MSLRGGVEQHDSAKVGLVTRTVAITFMRTPVMPANGNKGSEMSDIWGQGKDRQEAIQNGNKREGWE